MYKMLAIVFNDEKLAYEGVQALRDLNMEGSIEVFAAAVLQKDADGSVATKKVQSDFPLQTVAGTAIGGLIGLLGGLAGVAVGSAAGVVTGLIGDMYTANVDGEFLAGQPGLRLGALELRINTRTEARYLRLKLRLAISARLRFLGLQLIELSSGIRCGSRPLLMLDT